MNYPLPNPKKLRSPLLDGMNSNLNKSKQKPKKIYFNVKEEIKPEKSDWVSETLDNSIFLKKTVSEIKSEKSKNINQEQINFLETMFCIASILICSVGGIVSLLELINVITTLQSCRTNIGSSLISFAVVFICTITANILCIGFIHLIKTTRYLYSNFSEQKEIIQKLSDIYKLNQIQ